MNELESIAWILFAATSEYTKTSDKAIEADEMLDEFRKRLNQAANSDISTSNIDTEYPEL